MDNKETETTEKVQKDFKKLTQEIYLSIKEHLEPSYRKQYNIRRFLSCFILYFFILIVLKPVQVVGESYYLSLEGFVAFVYSIISWIFWHYSFWSYQNGIIDKFSRNIIHFGSILSLAWRIIGQNMIILLWIAFIAPFSGIKTWRKALKHNKILFVDNTQNDVWK